LRKAYSVASYITINISSPNTKNLRQLQQGDELRHLISSLKAEQLKLQAHYNKYTPLVLKIAPDLNENEINTIAQLLVEFEIDGVIATNTTLSREAIASHSLAQEAGGLSGLPLKDKSTEVVRLLAQTLNKKIPIIAAGGIFSAQDAQEKINVGASLVQIYSGFIYHGSQLISDIASQK
jgi:dihydroorotate dehydrogenase